MTFVSLHSHASIIQISLAQHREPADRIKLPLLFICGDPGYNRTALDGLHENLTVSVFEPIPDLGPLRGALNATGGMAKLWEAVTYPESDFGLKSSSAYWPLEGNAFFSSNLTKVRNQDTGGCSIYENTLAVPSVILQSVLSVVDTKAT